MGNSAFSQSNIITPVPIDKGGTGQDTAALAINALLPSQTGHAGKYLTTNGSVASWETVTGGGVGDVVGPASATDNALARFDSTTGKLIQNSSATLSDGGALTVGSLALGTDLPITEGGTGASDASTARTNLGLGSIATQASSAVSITGGSITGITDLAVADGGTGSSTALGARTNLLAQNKVFYTVGPNASDDYPTTGTADNVQIQAAIDAAYAAGGGTVYIKKGTYVIAGRITAKSNVMVKGAGRGVTILQGYAAFDYTIYAAATLSNFILRDMTIDTQNGSSASAVQLYYASNCVVERIEFKNVASGWMLKIGVSDGATEGVLCADNKIIDCDFDTCSGSLEELLVFNAKNTQIRGCKFSGKTSGNCVGLWQKCYDTKIVNCHFKDCTGGGIYYSITVENTVIENCYFENTGSGILGANISDNGVFGLSKAENLKIINPTIIGGSNSTSSTGIQLGAVNNAEIINPHIEEMQTGIGINAGNNSANASATNWVIVGGSIRNNNASANFHVLHPGIGFGGIGGSLYGRIIGVSFYDDQGTATQRYPITFDGAYTWDEIDIVYNRLSRGDGSGASIALADSAVLGSNVKIYSNHDYTGSSPAQMSVGTGDVVGPSSSTDNAITRFDSTTGKLVQNSAASIADSGQMTISKNSDSTNPTSTRWGASESETLGHVFLLDTVHHKEYVVGHYHDSSGTIKGAVVHQAYKSASDGLTGAGEVSIVFQPYAGNVGVGLLAATARFHLAAGTATANTAPLKLTTGTALTTPEDGALEYHSSHLYFTIGSTRYQLDQQTSGLVIGTNVQAWDADLDTLAGLTATTDNFIVAVSSAWASRTPAQVKTTLGLDLVENTALSTWSGSSNITTLGTIATGVWSGTAITVAKGGTGQTSYTDGQLLIGNSTGNTLAKATLTGTSNQITVTNGGGSITLSTPQNIHTGASPTFVGLILSGAVTNTIASGGNAIPLTLVQNDTTNNPVVLSITNTGTGITGDWQVKNIAVGSTNANLRIFTTDTATQHFGGSIILGGYYDATTSQTGFAGIAGRKENTTAANTRGYLQLAVNGSERVRVTSDGDMLIGGAGPTSGRASLINFGWVTTAAKILGMERNTTSNTAGNSLTILAQGATSGATDKAGGNLILKTGISTGTAYSYMQHQTYSPVNSSAAPLASGTTDGQLIDRLTIGAFKALTDGSAVNLVNFTLASNTVIGAIIRYAVEVFDGTNLQMETGEVTVQCANKGGVFSGNTVTQIGSAKQFLGSGSLTMTWAITGANPAVLSLNADTSLTPSTGYPRITYTIENLTQQAIAIQ